MRPISKHQIANHSGIPSIVNRINRHRLLVVTYHGLHDERQVEASRLPATFVRVSSLKEQLQWLQTRYKVIHPETLLEAIGAQKRLPDNAALVTFDDAYGNFHRLAAPLFEMLRLVPIVFVPTMYVATRQAFWYDLVWYFMMHGAAPERKWFAELSGLKLDRESKAVLAEKCLGILKKKSFAARNCLIERLEERLERDKRLWAFPGEHFCAMTSGQIRELSGRGFYFGGHTHTHTILTAQDDYASRDEININKTCIEAITGNQVYFFAYPNGGFDDFHDQHKEMLRNAGYVCAFTLIQGRTTHLVDPMALGRINVSPEDDIDSLGFRCAGMTPLIKKANHLMRR